MASHSAAMIGRSEWERLAEFLEDMAAAARGDEPPEGAGPAEAAWAQAAALVRAVADGGPTRRRCGSATARTRPTGSAVTSSGPVRSTTGRGAEARVG